MRSRRALSSSALNMSSYESLVLGCDIGAELLEILVLIFLLLWQCVAKVLNWLSALPYVEFGRFAVGGLLESFVVVVVEMEAGCCG